MASSMYSMMAHYAVVSQEPVTRVWSVMKPEILEEVREITMDSDDIESSIDEQLSPHSIFYIPELLHNILDKVDSPALLVNCALVNKLWSEEAFQILWHGDRRSGSQWRTPDLVTLIELAQKNPERLRKYVGNIKELTVFPDPAKEYADIDFDTLFDTNIWCDFRGKYFKLNIAEQVIEQKHIRCLLNVKLKEIFVQNALFSETILEDFKTLAPNLNDLTFGDRTPTLPNHELVRYLKDCKIEELQVKDEYVNTVDFDLLERLFDLPDLHVLILDDFVMNADFFHGIRVSSSTSLRQLRITVDDISPLRRLLRQLPKLKGLNVDSTSQDGDFNEDVLEPITACCPLLDQLRMNARHMSIDGNRLEKFARGRTGMRLLSLELREPAPGHITVPQLCAVVAHWPKLEVLMTYHYVQIKDLKAEHIIRIGRSCPELKRFIILGSIDPGDLQQVMAENCRSTLFPRLRCLDLGVRLFYTEPVPSDTEHFLIGPQDIIQTQGFGFDLNDPDTDVEMYSVTRTLAPWAVERITSKIESCLMSIAPQLRSLKSRHITRHMVSDNQFEENSSDVVTRELIARFNERCPPPRCDRRGWCECWRVLK